MPAPVQVHYVCVAYKGTVLAEAGSSAKTEAEFGADMPGVLANFAEKDDMRAFDQKPGGTFAVLVVGGLTLVVYADDAGTREGLYGLLGAAAKQFQQRWSQAEFKFAGPRQMQDQFRQNLDDLIKKATDFQPQTSEILEDLEEVKVLATNNLQAVMRRSDKLNGIE